MGLLDNELNKVISGSKKLKWALCMFCRVPFLTVYSSNVCERCEVNLEVYKKLLSRVMLMFILFICVNTVVTLFSIIHLLKHSTNFYAILAVLTFESFIIGYVLWRIIVSFIYNPKVNG